MECEMSIISTVDVCALKSVSRILRSSSCMLKDSIPWLICALRMDSVKSICSSWSPKDRKSTRLNSSHTVISYAVFCLKKKKKNNTHQSETSGRCRRAGQSADVSHHQGPYARYLRHCVCEHGDSHTTVIDGR